MTEERHGPSSERPQVTMVLMVLTESTVEMESS